MKPNWIASHPRALLLPVLLLATSCPLLRRPLPPCPTCPPPPPPVRSGDPCIVEAPPADRTVDLLIGGERDCPLRFAVCMEPGATGTLLNERRELRLYSDRAWIRCGTRGAPDGGP